MFDLQVLHGRRKKTEAKLAKESLHTIVAEISVRRRWISVALAWRINFVGGRGRR